MINNNDKHITPSNIARTLQDDNFIPFENIDHDAFINDDNERPMKGCPSPELQHDSDSDDESKILACMNFTINNNEDSIYTEIYLLSPSIDYDCSCADFPVDELSDSDTIITCNYIGDEVPEEPHLLNDHLSACQKSPLPQLLQSFAN